ncbi:acyl-CoA thioesterase [Hazenella coriacea]|uniref:Acyl-CoA thioester hydrolase n=1 Tax=Hazenella coriacea TaxID=1179467 RepID=A0A4R3LBS1_9BACL|nr:thioesterase family protein [Hazenella coriacea]TCS96748.1 acyl-CoA thioester hydrolase [Hazenella coriacea]
MSNYHETTLRVRYQETDQMGVVYHSNYLIWFEVGRNGFIRQQGYSYQDFENKGLLLPVVEAQCKYRSPAKYDEEVLVRTKLSELSGSKMYFEYEVVRNNDQTLLATGLTKHLWVSKEMKRTNMKKYFPELYERLASFVTLK